MLFTWGTEAARPRAKDFWNASASRSAPADAASESTAVVEIDTTTQLILNFSSFVFPDHKVLQKHAYNNINDGQYALSLTCPFEDTVADHENTSTFLDSDSWLQ